MAMYVVEKAGNGQRFCNCANSQFGEGYTQTGEVWIIDVIFV